jgi:DNA-binding transcriptional MocR family regulator
MNKFTMIPLEMLGDSRLQPLDIVVYAALDSFADSAGSAWPSLRAIAERGRVSSATVKRAVQRLQSAGYILKEQRRAAGKKEFDSTLYRLSYRAGVDIGSAAAEVEPAGAGVGSLEYGGLAPAVQEVGSESSRNYNHRTITNELNGIDEREIEGLFNELWERYPRKDYRGEAKKVFIKQFSPAPGTPRETMTRRLKTLNDKFLVLEERAEGQLARGEAFIPCLHNWLEKEDFTDV